MFEKMSKKRFYEAEELYKKGEYKKSERIFLNIHPNLPSYTLESIMICYYIAEMNYRKLISSASYSTAETYYLRALDSIRSNYPEKIQLISDMELKLGITSYRLGNSKKALEYLTGKTEPEAIEVMNAISDEKRRKELQLQQEKDKISTSNDVKWLKEQGHIYEKAENYTLYNMCDDRAVELNDGEALLRVAISYINGINRKQNTSKGITYLKEAAKTSERETALKLLETYGESPEKISPRQMSFEERRMCLQAAIDCGDDSALIKMGSLYIKKGKIRLNQNSEDDIREDILRGYGFYVQASQSSDPTVREYAALHIKAVENTLG